MQPTQLKIFLVIFFLIISQLTHAEPIAEFESKLSRYQGDIVYIDFWASWCGPCIKSFPWMNEMQSRYEHKGLKIISINLDSDFSLARKFLSSNPATFDVIYDPEGVLAKKYHLKGMPSSFILDRKSNVISAHVGFTEQKSEQYHKEIIALLTK
ncbi:TlpA disulfide reductase family protein [Thalassotalea profundi]|uniref:Thioredoxin domain-containing protein n=1 Tax=Thalassotalea profundi TaxID=2036687 RepID=A0ABQ3IBG9_9GAMM|nr:TlpA disulfide reductase family protein [Thalassotalea profundi]GHE77264.1 hypothetical protein GCM10011501_00920 [Thalassotalea profundi]